MEQERKDLGVFPNYRQEEPGQVFAGSASNPQACLPALGKQDLRWEKAAQPAQGPYQVPEALVFAWILTAQNICQHTVHLAHVQSDPVEEEEQERAGCGERLSLHIHVRKIPLPHSTEDVRQMSFAEKEYSS